MLACCRVHHAARSNPNLEVLKLVIASETNGLADVRCPKVIRWAEALYDRNHDGALPLHLAATNANPDVFTFIAARRALGFETETTGGSGKDRGGIGALVQQEVNHAHQGVR